MTTKLDVLMDDLIDVLLKHHCDTDHLRDVLREAIQEELPNLDTLPSEQTP